MDRIKKPLIGLALIVVFLAVIQILRIGIENIVFLFVERTNFSDRVASFIAMLVLSILLVIIARKRKIELSVFPTRFGVVYIIATVVAAALFILTPILTHNHSMEAIILLCYSAIVVPLFEELIFRSIVWNQLSQLFKREWIVYLVNVLLFALWHLGYVDSLAFRVETGLANIMFWKVITGLCFGVLLGAVRLKAKNSYCTMLLHGIMNIFGR